MTSPQPMAVPPAEDDEDAYVFVDHREEETSIVEYVSAQLAPEDALEVDEDDGQITVRHRGQAHAIPLQFSPHDRYVMISSLAELLAGRYRFFVLKPSLDGDTHGLLVVPEADAQGWPTVPDHLLPLDKGYDYFGGIRVPYLNHEDAAPGFEEDRERVAAAKDAMGGLVQALFSGKLDASAAALLAQAAMKDPEARKAAEGKTEAELAAEIQQAFGEALSSPELAQNRREMDQALADLKALTNPPPKPWWKVW
ncbi:MAG: hypothetical protein IPK34_01120 [Ramlibacter sp.]|nr:hypothetical protein [Ramlibacter sp.]